MTLPRHEWLALREAVSGRPREFWVSHPEAALSHAQAALLDRWSKARAAGAPLAYLLGFREFYGRRFWVNKDTLIPRADTELLVDITKSLVQRQSPCGPIRLADLGTGSGCIAISLALEIKSSTVVATDACEKALRVARNNASWLGAKDRVSFVSGSWWQAFQSLDKKFHGIVSNPPYIRPNDPHLAQGDLQYEPIGALTPCDRQEASSGLEAIETIAHGAVQHLEPGGFVLIEHGFDQQQEVAAIFAREGLLQIRCFKDLAGNPRAVVGFHA